MRSRVYEGWVRHARRAPAAHAFRYRVFQMYLDLDELPELFDGRWLWSARGPALAWFRRADHVGDRDADLADTVRALVAERTGRRPGGPVRLLTHLRYLGYCMNPVSFYYCFAPDGETLEAIVAEVANTPWGERHCYALDCRGAPPGGPYRFRFDKAFHVSPFMAMDQEYRWRLSHPGATLAVAMENREAGERVFSAAMRLDARPVTATALAAVLARHPAMTARVVAGIYWQALRLAAKGARFHPHPKHGAAPEARA